MYERVRAVLMRRSVIAVVAACALIVGSWWVKERTWGEQLAEACGGILPVDQVAELSGASVYGFGGDMELTSYDLSGAEEDEPERVNVGCYARLAGRGEAFGVSVDTAAHVGVMLDDDEEADEHLPVALKHGWTGYAVQNDERVRGHVLLECRNWNAAEGDGLLVGVRSASGSLTELGRFAAETARRAARKTGCDADFGSEITQVGASETVPSEKADGTCEGVRSRSSVREAPAGSAPLEYCILRADSVGALGTMWLSAEYGPFYMDFGVFDEPAARYDDAAYGTAHCPGALSTAFYTISSSAVGNDRDFEETPLTDRELADLRHFAEQSAARHGCSDLVLPEGA